MHSQISINEWCLYYCASKCIDVVDIQNYRKCFRECYRKCIGGESR